MDAALAHDFLALMRHAEPWNSSKPKRAMSDFQPSLTRDGVADTRGVGSRLDELMSSFGIARVTVYHVGTAQSKHTAEILCDALEGTRREVRNGGPLPSLAPHGSETASGGGGERHLPTYTSTNEQVTESWETAQRALGTGDACVIVGHEPQLSWLARHLVRESVWTRLWTPAPAPLANGELMILHGSRDKGRLSRPRFVISPSDPATRDQLLMKIDSKMKTAGVLGGFLTAAFLWLLKDGLVLDRSHPASLALGAGGAALLAIAVLLYFITLFLYDRLLMPPRFWGTAWASDATTSQQEGREHRGNIRRPPASDVRVLFDGMLTVWKRAFVPATISGALGILAIVLANLQLHGAVEWAVAIGAIATIGAIGVAVERFAATRMGVND